MGQVNRVRKLRFQISVDDVVCDVRQISPFRFQVIDLLQGLIDGEMCWMVAVAKRIDY